MSEPQQQQQQKGYDMRLLAVSLINMEIRPQLGLFFADYSASPHSLLKVLVLLLFLFCFVFTPVHLVHLNGRLNVQFGHPQMPSSFLSTAFLFSLLCPTFVFPYVYPLIILCSVCPSFFQLLRLLSHRFRNVFLAFLFPSPPSLPPKEHPESLV